MWNTLSQHLQGAPAPQGTPPQAKPAPAPAAPPPQAAPQAPPQAAGAPPQAAPPQGGADSNSDEAVVTRVLVARAKTLSPQESQDFFNGITVPALQVLKKILPEIGPAIDGAIAKKQGGGAAPGAAPPQAGAAAPGAPPPQAAPAQPPVSRLRQI